jgi:MFS family permease
MNINRKALMIASFLTLIAAGAGFATRAASAPAWAKDFDISLATFGTIMGAGFLGFGLFIFLGGLLVELFGYKKLLLVAVILHIVSAIMLLMAPSLHAGWLDADGPAIATSKVTNVLYWSVFLFAVCNGLYEAVINPLIGQIYPENQTHYLNILHAGWPGGLIVGGILAACFQNDTAWITEIPWQYALTTYSVVLIILLMIVVKESFPDTVSQGGKVSFVTLFGCFASIPFLVLIVLHGLIGYMELGVDSWQTRLMENLVENSVTILIYTSFLMFGLRFFAGPIAHRINPIGLLFVSSLLAVGGLLWLGSEITSVLVIFAAATLYAFGKAFLWPTMLAVVGERYPNSGAVAMSTLGASGMLCVGFIGAELIGVQQSIATTDYLQENNRNIYVEFKAAEDSSFPSWGKNLGFSLFEFNQLTGKKQQEAMEKEKKLGDAAPKPITTAYDHGSRVALTKTAAIPTAMAIGFLGLLLYFRSIGGYKVLHMDDGGDAPEDDDGGAYAAEPDGGGTYAAEDDGGGGEKAGEAEPDDEPSPD